MEEQTVDICLVDINGVSFKIGTAKIKVWGGKELNFKEVKLEKINLERQEGAILIKY